MNDKKEICISIPRLGFEEKQALCDVIDSGWITMGEKVKKFEKAFAKMHGVKGAVAVNSCTAALHLSLKALNIGPGDEVMVPSLTFVATANSVLYVGAEPVFIDIQKTVAPNISIEDAMAKWTPRTKAVIVVHYGGYLGDMSAWRLFCDSKGMLLIEDSAHAPGIEGVGHWSDACAFSFFSNKNMSTAEGGMVIARDEEVLNHIRLLRTHGMTTDTLARDRGHAYSYDVTDLGYNYRMDELRAAMGIVQLDRLEEWNKRRCELTEVYRDNVASYIPEVGIPFENTVKTCAHLMPVLLPEKVNREQIMKELRDAGIQSSIHYPPIHRFSYYRERYAGDDLPITEKFCDSELTLPLHPSLTENEVKRVVVTLSKAIEAARH